MVYYSQQSLWDLKDIFDGLLSWEKHVLDYEHVVNYHDAIRLKCSSLDKLTFHFPCSMRSFRSYGKYLHRYRRNSKTIWYIIYNTDEYSNVYIQRIFSNHTTKDAE